MTATCRLTGRLTVPLPPDRAFRLFTPLGERDWVPGWQPHFPAAADDAAPGTVFETHAPGESERERTIWVVVDCVPGRRIVYARLAPHGAAGTVTVTLDDAGGQSEVTVTYALTALTEAADDDSTRSVRATAPTSPPGRTPSPPRSPPARSDDATRGSDAAGAPAFGAQSACS